MEEKKTISIDDFKRESKKRERKERINNIKAAVKDTIKWCFDHPVESVGIVTSVSLAVRRAIRYRQTKAEDRRRDIDFYDNRVGKHVKIRRKLNRREQIEVDRRYRENKDETYTNIFADMGLLK